MFSCYSLEASSFLKGLRGGEDLRERGDYGGTGGVGERNCGLDELYDNN